MTDSELARDLRDLREYDREAPPLEWKGTEMTRGRKPFADKRVRREVQIPESIALRIDVLAHDPLRGKAAHGKWSEIVTEALREWLNRMAGLGGERE